MNYKLFYIIIGALLTINIIEFFTMNSYATPVKTESQYSNSDEPIVNKQFNLKEMDGCPNKIAGNSNSVLKIKYFYNDLCPYCRQEAPILDRLLNRRGSLFYIEMYDIDKCREDSIKEGVLRIPFFVFMADGKKNSGGGFVKEEDLEKFICNVTQNC